MTDTDPDFCLSRMIVWGKKRRKGHLRYIKESSEMLPLTAMHAILQSQLHLCVEEDQQVFLILKINSRLEFSIYQHAVRKQRVLDSDIFYDSANVSCQVATA